MSASFDHDTFISKIMLKILKQERFFASLAMSMGYREDPNIPTAATNGREIMYNKDFMTSMSGEEQTGVILHEILHAALCHVIRRGSRDPFIWNIACDININGQITNCGYKLPQGCVFDKDLQDLSSEEIYEQLIKKGKEREQNGGQGNTQGQGKQKGGGNQQPSGSGGKTTQEHTYDHIADKYGIKKDKFFEDMLEGDELTEEQKKELKDMWTRRMQQAKLAGKTPAGMTRELDAFGASKIPWHEVLRRWTVSHASDFNNFDRRFIYRGEYNDALDGEKLKVHCCVDTSGSVDDVVLGKFYTEVNSILRCYENVEMDLYFCDTELFGPYPITKRTAKPQAKGGGGTCFEPIFDKLKKKKKELVVYLTDGYGSFPSKPGVETIWVVIEGGLESDRFPFGRVIRMSE